MAGSTNVATPVAERRAFMRLIQLAVSMSSFKVRLALRLKELELPIEDPPGGTYRSEAFRAINPAGTIPTLVDGDFWLAESDTVIDYLDDIGAGKRLRPDDPREAARARMLSRWIDFRLDPAVRRLFPNIAPKTRDPEALKQVDESLAASLALIEGALDRVGPFTCGEQPTIADCGLCACLVWLEALRPVLALRAAPGTSLLRLVEAMAAERRTARAVEDYRAIVKDWLFQRLGA